MINEVRPSGPYPLGARADRRIGVVSHRWTAMDSGIQISQFGRCRKWGGVRRRTDILGTCRYFLGHPRTCRWQAALSRCARVSTRQFWRGLAGCCHGTWCLRCRRGRADLPSLRAGAPAGRWQDKAIPPWAVTGR
jgi:hypothetical protein